MKKINFLINYGINSKKAIKIALDKYKKGKKEYILFGTTHERMLNHKIYNLQIIKNLVDNIKPDLIIFEANKIVYKKNNVIDGRIDMQYVYSYAQEKEIIYTMMDNIKYDGSIYPNKTNMIRDRQMYANMKTEKYENSGANKVLVFTGVYHKFAFDEIFIDHGYKIDKTFDKNVAFKEDGKIYYNNFLFSSLNKKYKYIENVIEKRLDGIENYKCREAWKDYFVKEKKFLKEFIEENNQKQYKQ